MADQLRMVSWNACDGFMRKFGHLERLRPDIAILQEVRLSCLEYAALKANSIWLGAEGQKGLAAVGYGGWQLSAAPIVVPDKWFLPLWATKDGHCINIVAVWVDSTKDCVPPTLRALNVLHKFITSGPTIFAGDFNQSVTLDKRKVPGRRFRDVLDAFGKHGMSSAWHQLHAEEHGEETSPTHYWRWNPESKFHIDFAFGSPGLKVNTATLGAYDKYVLGKVSDHVPLIVDYELPSSGAP
jgi:exonuclease III